MGTPFIPELTITIAAVNATSVRGQLPASSNQGRQLEVTNPTNGIIWVKTGDVTVVAAIGDYPVVAGGSKRFSMRGLDTHIAVRLIAAATDGSVYVSRGEEQ